MDVFRRNPGNSSFGDGRQKRAVYLGAILNAMWLPFFDSSPAVGAVRYRLLRTEDGGLGATDSELYQKAAEAEPHFSYLT